MNSTPEPIDESTARELALAALAEITPVATVGEPAESTVHDDGVLTLRFENRLSGYPGWFWTVSLAQVDESAPTVLEVELIPGDGALIAPDWLPWAERLAEYQAAQAALAAEGLATDDLIIAADEEDLDDVDDLDASDFDDDGSPILHSGDVDGVDIDELSDDAVDDESEDADDEDDDDGDDESDDVDDEDDDDDSDDDVEDAEDEDVDDDDDESDDDDDDRTTTTSPTTTLPTTRTTTTPPTRTTTSRPADSGR